MRCYSLKIFFVLGLTLVFLACGAGQFGYDNLLSPDGTEKEETADEVLEVIDVDGETVPLDADYSYEFDSDQGVSGVSPIDEEGDAPSSGLLEGTEPVTVGMLPTPAKNDEEDCTEEGEVQVTVRSLEGAELTTSAYLEWAATDFVRSRRFFTSSAFVTSLSFTSRGWTQAVKQEKEAKVGFTAEQCQLDADGSLRWTDSDDTRVFQDFELMIGFVDEDQRFSDQNGIVSALTKGVAQVPVADLLIKRGESVYLTVLDKRTDKIQDNGAVVLRNENSRIRVIFPPSLVQYFKKSQS